MALRHVLARLGAGSASVDAVLASATTTPGGTVSGTVHLTGGKVSQEFEGIRVSLEAVVEVEQGDSTWHENVTFANSTIAEPSTIEPAEQRSLPFTLAVPWQCPFTTIDGWQLQGMRVGLRTRVDIAGAVDPSDLDPVAVTPLPVQRTVLQALDRLGFGFHGAEVEKGRLPGSELPFYQEVEFTPPSGLRSRLRELEVTFLTDPDGVDVVLEVDKRGGLLAGHRDVAGRLRLRHDDSDVTAMASRLDAAITALGARRRWR